MKILDFLFVSPIRSVHKRQRCFHYLLDWILPNRSYSLCVILSNLRIFHTWVCHLSRLNFVAFTLRSPANGFIYNCEFSQFFLQPLYHDPYVDYHFGYAMVPKTIPRRTFVCKCRIIFILKLSTVPQISIISYVHIDLRITFRNKTLFSSISDEYFLFR